jgi:hypothetical protein
VAVVCFAAISVSDLIPERDTKSEDVFAVPRVPRDLRPSISQSARYVLDCCFKYCEKTLAAVLFILGVAVEITG